MRNELRAIGVTNPWAALQALRNFARTVWDPTDSDVRRGINGLVYGALREVDAEQLREIEARQPAVAALFAEGYDPALEPARLERLPDGTLGREYLRFLRANGIDPLGELLEMPRPTNLAEYLFRRAYKLHDVLHVVLGCDASVLGEVRIVSYSLGQAASGSGRAPALALAVLFLHLALRKPGDVPEAVRLAADWMGRGERAAFYAAFRLEDWMDRPVVEVRERVMAC
jgi:ubiquinone biosynthesis protein Coq4